MLIVYVPVVAKLKEVNVSCCVAPGARPETLWELEYPPGLIVIVTLNDWVVVPKFLTHAFGIFAPVVIPHLGSLMLFTPTSVVKDAPILMLSR